MAAGGERFLGLVTFDRPDRDYGWVLLHRDLDKRFRCVDVNTSLRTPDLARAQLFQRCAQQADRTEGSFAQEDERRRPVDFLTPVVPPARLNTLFKTLTEDPGYSPAKGIIEAMMRYHEDVDGNFVEQFQTSAFDARLWELYLFALASELGYGRDPAEPVPDFILQGPRGRLAIEAVTINPAAGLPPARPNTIDELLSYQENYVPIRFARALRRKMDRHPHYWDLAHCAGQPFVIAIQDFHAPGAMKVVVPALTEYLFGYRHSMRNGQRVIAPITEHRWGHLTEPSGFFAHPGAEHVSAVICNPQGTLPKFTRLGYLAEFGDRNVRMVKRGLRRGERDGQQYPIPFSLDVTGPAYSETWVEGLVVLHNPRARFPVDPALFEGAAQEFLQPDGRIMSLIPDFHPVLSETMIVVDKDDRSER